MELNGNSSGENFHAEKFVLKRSVLLREKEKMRVVPFLGLLLGKGDGKSRISLYLEKSVQGVVFWRSLFFVDYILHSW